MSSSEQEFLDELREAFAIEAGEHFQTIASGLIEIEKQRDPAKRQSVMESVCRAVHSLKGAARSVNLPAIGAVCQSVESVLSAMKKEEMTPGAADFDVLQRAVDGMARLLTTPMGEPDGDIVALMGQLESMAAPGKKAAPPRSAPATVLPEPAGGLATGTGPAPARPATDTIRIATSKLDAILLQAEELISVKLVAEQRIAELAETLGSLDAWKAAWEKSVTGNSGLRSIPASPPGTGGGDGNLSRLRELGPRLRDLLAALQADRRSTGMLVDQLLENTKTLLMLPFSNLFQAFPRMVRDISRELDKEVDLVLTGGEIEIDKRILERMKDPLIHLVRNGIDHGIEPLELRRTRDKKPAGTITLSVSPAEGNRVQILVSDDGAGIDTAKLREAAVQHGILSRTEAEALDDPAALALMFKSGLSTRTRVTDLSGRGLGMAIVQEAVEGLGGAITFSTSQGKGTTFRVSLPLTLATFHGLLFQEYGRVLVVPVSNVERVLRIRKEEVRTVENRETIRVDGAPLALVRLGAALGLASSRNTSADRSLLSVMVLSSGPQRMAFSVDQLLHQQEILLKGLGRQLARVRNIAGATVLGSGQVVPVLNVADLFKSAVGTGLTITVPQAPEAKARRKSILVVEDSITSRMLLKNILASAGFEVCTVIDGVEAWTTLKERPFDAVVSDIEMPRMDGFALTARIRGDGKLAELPVVLVTSRGSPSDRERGIEVGANAYIVKSSFEQSNLLEAIRRLV
jgi:two-component system chemotaxis sensor kinase CheA